MRQSQPHNGLVIDFLVVDAGLQVLANYRTPELKARHAAALLQFNMSFILMYIYVDLI